MSHDRPELAGGRYVPPTGMPTALAAGGMGRNVLLHFLDRGEEATFTRALEAKGWGVLVADDLLDIAACVDEEAAMVITDDPSLLRTLPGPWEASKPPMIVVVEDRDSAIAGAWSAGADWVITRPIDPDDPLR